MATNSLPDQKIGMALASNSYPDPILKIPDGWDRMNLATASLPTAKFEPGWNSQKNASGTIENSFEVFVNDSTHQIVLSFKGSDALSNWTSDVLNNGSSEFFKIQEKAQAAFDALSTAEAYAGYSFSTTGHSLGGGMAQSFALKNSLDTQVYNSLPVPAATLNSPYFGAGGYEAALARYVAEGHTVQDIRTPNDIATYFYSRDSAGMYLSEQTDQAITMLPGAYMPTAIKTLLLAGATPFGLAALGIDHTMGALSSAQDGLGIDPVTGEYLIPANHADFAAIPSIVRQQFSKLSDSPVIKVDSEGEGTFVVQRADGTRQWLRVDAQTGDTVIQQANALGGHDVITMNARSASTATFVAYDRDGDRVQSASVLAGGESVVEVAGLGSSSLTKYYDANGVMSSSVERTMFDDGSYRQITYYPDGRTVSVVVDADGDVVDGVPPSGGADAGGSTNLPDADGSGDVSGNDGTQGPGLDAVIGTVQGLQSLLQAIEAGNTRAIVTASAALLANMDRVAGGAILPEGVAPGLNALASALNLVSAIQDGNGLAIAGASLNLGSQAAAMYAGMLKDQGIVAFQSESASAGTLLENGAIAGQAAGALALAASVVQLVMAVEGGNGYQIAAAGLSTIAAGMAVAGYTAYVPPVAFAAVAVTMIGSMLSEKDLPTLEGEATAIWNPDGSIHVVKTLDAENGGATPASVLENLVSALQQSLSYQVDANGNPLYAIIPQRLPTIGFVFDPDGGRIDDSAGQLYLKWIDENGQEQTRYYNGNGERYDQSQANLAQDFMAHALSAIVPAWEAASVLSHMVAGGTVTAATSGSVAENQTRAAQQLHSADWQAARPDAGMPEVDADGIHQHFTALTVDIGPVPSVGSGSGRIGKNVDLDAYIEQTDWVKANEGILSIDVNGDGRISQDEILTNDSGAYGTHARNSLQWLDVNHDGKLDASDPAFAALGIWLDVNRNGQTDAGEFSSFLDRGIASLDFTSVPPILVARDGGVLPVTEQHLTADVRGDYYQAAFADTDADGKPDAFAGILHAREGGETVLNAVVTHDYAGEAGHTHGGEAALDATGELRLEAGDDRIQTASDRHHVQVLAEDVILAGDIRVTDGSGGSPIETTATIVGVGDGRLRSNVEADAVKPGTRTETVKPNDVRLASGPSTSVSDEYAAIRAEWVKSGDSLFESTGTLVGIAVGAVAGVANARPHTAEVVTPVPGSGNTEATNTVSHMPVLGDTVSTRAEGISVPAFNAGTVLPQVPSDRAHPTSPPEVLTVEVLPAQVHTTAKDAASPVVASPEAESPGEQALGGSTSDDVRNTPPDVMDERVEGVEDTRYTFDARVLLANDTTKSFSTKPLQLTGVFGAEHGTVEIVFLLDGSQRVVFTPDQDYWGPARFRYVVTDEYGLQSQGRVYLDIAPVNDAPVAIGETASIDEDNGVLFTSAQLLANDFDVDTPTIGDVLSILKVSDAQHGLVALDVQGNVRFLPDHDYFGPASFTYWVSDGNGGLSPAVVNLEIRPVNDVPVVTGEAIATDEDTVLLIEQGALLANDTDVDNVHADLTVFSVRDGQHGSVELTPEGLVRFVPEQDYYGTATFFYTVSDGSGGFTEALATVNLAPVNDAPTVKGETFGGNEDEAATFTAASLLQNDRDVDDPQSSLILVAVGNALHGEVRLNADGTITFIPEPDFFGRSSFEYTVADPHGAQSIARMDIDLAPVNDTPRLRSDIIESIEDTILTIDPAALLINDIDVDNAHDELIITRVHAATNGAVVLNEDGSIRFVPDQDFFGEATFKYDVSDGVGGVSTATATVHVAPVNDAPIANDNVVDGRKGVAITMTAAALLADDFDVDNPHSDLRIVGVSGADHGTVRLNADGSVTFLPEAGYGGYPGAHGTFTYTVSDGAGGFATATTTVNLEKINTTPVAVDDGFSGYENTPFVINSAQFLANDRDPDGDTLAVTQVANAQHGTVVIQPDGQVGFTPDPGFYGQASFQYQVSDPFGGQTWATAILDVVHVNRAPIIEAVEYGRAIFGYYYGPPVVVAKAGPGAGAGPNGAGSLVYGEGPAFQPVYDENLARSLSAEGRLLDASEHPYTPSSYVNGMLRPLALDQNDGDYFMSGTTVESDRMLMHADSPLLQMGRIIAYDPDGNSAAIVMSILQGPQHGYGYADTYLETRFGQPTSGQMVHDQAYWQYQSHVGDPYNGSDSFTIRVTDAQGASTDIVINATHKGTNGNGSLNPIVLDLDGNGVELISPDQSSVKADVNGDGQLEQIGWAAASDGVLGYDANGDGKISVEETQLTAFVPGAKTDLDALAAFDTNHDGKFSEADAEWGRFKVVQDANGDGNFEAGEQKTLDQLGIVSIGLQRQGTPHLDHANAVLGTVEVTHVDGSKSEAVDAMFAGKNIQLPGFATDAIESGKVPAIDPVLASHVASADAGMQAAGVHESLPVQFQSAEETQRLANLFVQMMNTQMTLADPIGFVPPHEDTLADIAARSAQAAAVDIGVGKH